jgi:hypothetical protein
MRFLGFYDCALRGARRPEPVLKTEANLSRFGLAKALKTGPTWGKNR